MVLNWFVDISYVCGLLGIFFMVYCLSVVENVLCSVFFVKLKLFSK